ncbi:hypothetical protein Tco_1034477 [Tanacetum coccineum]
MDHGSWLTFVWTFKSFIRIHLVGDQIGGECGGGCEDKSVQCVGGWFVGNGLCTKFWKDLWIGDTRLCDLFPRIYALENNKDAMVAEKLYSISASFRRSVRGGAEASQLPFNINIT